MKRIDKESNILTAAEYQAQYGQGVPKSRSKFNNQLTVVDGIKFHSKHEAAGWGEIKLRIKSNDVSFCLRQTPFHLPGGVKYLLDFLVASEQENGLYKLDFLDYKGKRTPMYITKMKQVQEIYGVTITEK